MLQQHIGAEWKVLYWRLVIKVNVVDQLPQVVMTGSGIDVQVAQHRSPGLRLPKVGQLHLLECTAEAVALLQLLHHRMVLTAGLLLLLRLLLTLSLLLMLRLFEID